MAGKLHICIIAQDMTALYTGFQNLSVDDIFFSLFRYKPKWGRGQSLADMSVKNIYFYALPKSAYS